LSRACEGRSKRKSEDIEGDLDIAVDFRRRNSNTVRAIFATLSLEKCGVGCGVGVGVGGYLRASCTGDV
jgi:hypothetical protein